MVHIRLLTARVLAAVGVGDGTVGESVPGSFVALLRHTVTDADEIAIYERYAADEVGEAVARLLLGDDLDAIRDERADFREATDADTDGMFHSD